MTEPPDLSFPLYSPHSRSRHDVHFHHMLAELETELLRRRDRYPQFIARRQLTEEEAARQIDLLAAVVADFNRYNWDDPGPGDHAQPYFDKVNCLRREICIRRALYPKLVGQGKLTHDQAARQLGRLEAAHDWYWNGDGLNRIASAGGSAGYDAWADEMDRRDSWMAAQPWPLRIPMGSSPEGRGAEVEAIATVYCRTAMPRPSLCSPGNYALRSHRYRHVGPGPFTVTQNPDSPPTWRILNAAGVDDLWSPDDYRSLDRAMLGPRFDGWPTISLRSALETIAAALNQAADEATAGPVGADVDDTPDFFQAAE